MEENKSPSNPDTGKKYAGSPWLSFTTLSIFTLTMICPVLTIKRAAEHPVIFAIAAILCLLLFYTFSSLRLNYFIVNKDILIIRNHFNFDEKDVIPLEDIAEMEIVNMPKGPKALLVVTKNGKSSAFNAASLRKRQWEEFKKDMAIENLIVKDTGRYFYGK